MKGLLRCVLLLCLTLAQHAFAVGIARIAAGDCTALAAAMNAPPTQEQALIVLARNATYTCSTLTVRGNIEVDGAGATLAEPASSTASIPKDVGILVTEGASLLLRNVTIGAPLQASSVARSAASLPGPKFCCFQNGAVVLNQGALTLDNVTLTGLFYYGGPLSLNSGIVNNSGYLVMRNVSVVGNLYTSGFTPALIANSGRVEISHSTFVTTPKAYTPALFSSEGTGVISIANSVLSNNGYAAAPICAAGSGRIVSRGGNVFTDSSCGLGAANDRLVADVRALDLAVHGGVVPTLALNYDSPAIGNGLATNCEAADARGLSRGASTCDSGAYEVGGGNGKLSDTGMSGLYFNAANNGHYVSIQRLYGDVALVIWNTFDQHGVPAWLYGVGTVGANRIHVPQVAQNVGGKLLPGGNVTPATATLWGSFDVDLSDCYSASLTYSSPLPQFGSGSTTLQRLAFLDGVNCAR